MKPIYTADFETDPFHHKQTIAPFCCGLYNGSDFSSWWSPRCADKLAETIRKFPEPSIIFIHNGGKFDVFLGLLEHFEPELRIINGRIVQAFIRGSHGVHEIRDSYAIIPIPLAAYKKDEIDIEKLERENRDANRVEILSYMRGDCVYLHELVTAFLDEFGDKLTIGSAAMQQLRRFHPFETVGKTFDEKFRSQFFFGGRVQCFQSGILPAPKSGWKVYDVNSMYPFVMKNMRHPSGGDYDIERRITSRTAFIVAEGTQRTERGAFPVRSKTGIDFETRTGTFLFSAHEWEASQRFGFFRVSRVIKTYGWDEWITFDEFVDHFYSARLKAKASGDTIRLLFYKLILNSAYGKFAQNPENYFDWAITFGTILDDGWQIHTSHNGGKIIVWKKPVERHSYYDVAIGASITGAARSVLMQGIAGSDDLAYCDTDSIIAGNLRGVEFSDTVLGAWKLEATGDRIAIAGKKLYALFDGGWGDEHCVKKATKGARLPPEDIVRVARGETIRFEKQAPTFKLSGDVTWISRQIKRTA